MDEVDGYGTAYRQLDRIKRRLQAMTLGPMTITDQYELGALAGIAGEIAKKATTFSGLLEMRSEQAARDAIQARQ